MQSTALVWTIALITVALAVRWPLVLLNIGVKRDLTQKLMIIRTVAKPILPKARWNIQIQSRNNRQQIKNFIHKAAFIIWVSPFLLGFIIFFKILAANQKINCNFAAWKSVPYVVPERGTCLIRSTFYKSRFRMWFPLRVIALYGRLFFFYLDFVYTVLYMFVVSMNT